MKIYRPVRIVAPALLPVAALLFVVCVLGCSPADHQNPPTATKETQAKDLIKPDRPAAEPSRQQNARDAFLHIEKQAPVADAENSTKGTPPESALEPILQCIEGSAEAENLYVLRNELLHHNHKRSGAALKELSNSSDEVKQALLREIAHIAITNSGKEEHFKLVGTNTRLAMDILTGMGQQAAPVMPLIFDGAVSYAQDYFHANEKIAPHFEKVLKACCPEGFLLTKLSSPDPEERHLALLLLNRLNGHIPLYILEKLSRDEYQQTQKLADQLLVVRRLENKNTGDVTIDDYNRLKSGAKTNEIVSMMLESEDESQQRLVIKWFYNHGCYSHKDKLFSLLSSPSETIRNTAGFILGHCKYSSVEIDDIFFREFLKMPPDKSSLYSRHHKKVCEMLGNNPEAFAILQEVSQSLDPARRLANLKLAFCTTKNRHEHIKEYLRELNAFHTKRFGYDSSGRYTPSRPGYDSFGHKSGNFPYYVPQKFMQNTDVPVLLEHGYALSTYAKATIFKTLRQFRDLDGNLFYPAIMSDIPEFRHFAVKTLYGISPGDLGEEVIEALQMAAEDENPETRAYAMATLHRKHKRITGNYQLESIIGGFTSPDKELQSAVAHILFTKGEPQKHKYGLLKSFLDNPDPGIRAKAARRLIELKIRRRWGPIHNVEPILALIQKKDWEAIGRYFIPWATGVFGSDFLHNSNGGTPRYRFMERISPAAVDMIPDLLEDDDIPEKTRASLLRMLWLARPNDNFINDDTMETVEYILRTTQYTIKSEREFVQKIQSTLRAGGNEASAALIESISNMLPHMYGEKREDYVKNLYGLKGDLRKIAAAHPRIILDSQVSNALMERFFKNNEAAIEGLSECLHGWKLKYEATHALVLIAETSTKARNILIKTYQLNKQPYVCETDPRLVQMISQLNGFENYRASCEPKGTSGTGGTKTIPREKADTMMTMIVYCDGDTEKMKQIFQEFDKGELSILMAKYMYHLGDPGMRMLNERLFHPKAIVREAAAYALYYAVSINNESKNALQRALDDYVFDVHMAAREALKKHGGDWERKTAPRGNNPAENLLAVVSNRREEKSQRLKSFEKLKRKYPRAALSYARIKADEYLSIPTIPGELPPSLGPLLIPMDRGDAELRLASIDLVVEHDLEELKKPWEKLRYLIQTSREKKWGTPLAKQVEKHCRYANARVAEDFDFNELSHFLHSCRDHLDLDCLNGIWDRHKHDWTDFGLLTKREVMIIKCEDHKACNVDELIQKLANPGTMDKELQRMLAGFITGLPTMHCMSYKTILKRAKKTGNKEFIQYLKNREKYYNRLLKDCSLKPNDPNRHRRRRY